MMSAAEIKSALSHAKFPIRNIEELHLALHHELGSEDRCKGCSFQRLSKLFSSRDFLFTNAQQIQELVLSRQSYLDSDDNALH